MQQRTTEVGDQIKALEADRFITIASRLPKGGSLQARRLSDGVRFYWRFSHAGKTHREPIGLYDPTSPPKKLTPGPKGYSVEAAKEACRELAEKHDSHLGGLLGIKADEAGAYATKRTIQAERSTRTLQALLAVYVGHLRAKGRSSAYDAELIFSSHVIAPFPALAAKAAADVSPDDMIDMQRRLIEAGKERTSNKLRSYLRAAYQCAVDVRTTAAIPVAFKPFNVTTNPAAATKRNAEFDRADKHPLTLAELRAYWLAIRDMPGLPGLGLRLHLLTGGQRIEQLLRLRWADVHGDTLTIFDGKGRPGAGLRSHVLPIVSPLDAMLAAQPRAGDFVVSANGGTSPVNKSAFATWARDAVGQSIAKFSPKRIRSGVETLLAANGVNQEVRGHVQSHGLTGVQNRHYNDHDFIAEKRQALELLVRLVMRKPTQNVVPLRKGSSRTSPASCA